MKRKTKFIGGVIELFERDRAKKCITAKRKCKSRSKFRELKVNKKAKRSSRRFRLPWFHKSAITCNKKRV